MQYYGDFESFEVWCWRRVEKISGTNRVKEEVLQRVKEERSVILKKTERLSGCHILRRNCLLRQVFEGKTEENERRKNNVNSY
jgi:hypothetical protein